MTSSCTLAFVYPSLEPPERPNVKLLDHPPPLASTSPPAPIGSPLHLQGGIISSSSSASSILQLSSWRAGEVGLSQYSATTDHTIIYDSQGSKTALRGQPLRHPGDFDNDPLLISTIQTSRPSLSSVQATCDEIARRTGDGCRITVKEVCLAPADEVMPSERIYVAYDKSKHENCATTWNFVIQGSPAQVDLARTAVRVEFRRPTGVIIKVDQDDVLNRPNSTHSPSPAQLLPIWRERLDSISFSSGAHVSVVPDVENRNGTSKPTCSIVVSGREEQVISAKLQLLVFLDRLRGLEVTELSLDWRLHSMLSGPRNVIVSRIERDCNVNIYVSASPFRRLTEDAGSLSISSSSHAPGAFPTPSNSSPGGLGLGLLGLNSPSPRSGAPAPLPLLTPPAPSPSNKFGGQFARPSSPTKSGRPGLATSSSSDYFAPRHAAADLPAKVDKYPTQVLISGSASAVQQAREAVVHTLSTLGRRMASKELLVPSHKIDWLIAEKGSDIRRYCRENGTFVSINASAPASADLIAPDLTYLTVGGESQIQIDRTVKQVTHLLPGHCSLSVRLLLVSLTGQGPSKETFARLHAIVGNMAVSTGAEVVFEDDERFELFGNSSQVRRVGTYILEMLLSMSNVMLDMRLRVECPLEHRDFISGKKEGKVKKVMQATGTRIRYEAISEYTFAIDVWGKDHSVLDAFDMIAAEMPAEGSFFLLEGFHKRIIGARGETIQAIMKRYGVYIKFASKQECVMNGGFIDPEDNVLMRTPAKNVASLEALRAEVMLMVEENDRDFVRARLCIPRRFHRVLAHEKRHLLDHIQRNYQILIIYPGRIQCEDYIEIYGSEAAIDHAVDEIINLLPVEHKTIIACNSKLPQFIASPTLPIWLLQIKADLKVDVVACDPEKTGGYEDAIFWMSCEKRFASNLARAEQALVELLAQNEVLSSHSMRASMGHVPPPAPKVALDRRMRVPAHGSMDDFPPLHTESRIISVSDPPISPSRRLDDLPDEPNSIISAGIGPGSASQSPSSGSPVAPSPPNRPLGAIGSEKPSRASSISSRSSMPLPSAPPPSMSASPSTRAVTGTSVALAGSPHSSRTQSLDLRELSGLSTSLKALTVTTPAADENKTGPCKGAMGDDTVSSTSSSQRQPVTAAVKPTGPASVQNPRTYASVGGTSTRGASSLAPAFSSAGGASVLGSAASIDAIGDRWINPSKQSTSSKSAPGWNPPWKQEAARKKQDTMTNPSSTMTSLSSLSSSSSRDGRSAVNSKAKSDASIWARPQ